MEIPCTGPIGKIVPEHTRDAFFQAYCDLRTNVPKDRKWVEGHAAALQPRTLPGWLVRHHISPCSLSSLWQTEWLWFGGLES